MQISERLKATREDLDITQTEAANAAGCSKRQIIRYEANEQEMTVSKLKALCLLYQTSADYILGLPKNLKWPRK